MSTNKIGHTEGVGLNIASHSFTEGGVTKHMERIAPGAGVMDTFDDTATVMAVGLVSGLSVDCTGKGRIVFAVKAATANGDFCTFRLVFKNGNGDVIGTSVLTQSSFTELTSGGSPDYRYGTVSAFANDCGATSAEVYIVQISSNESMVCYLAAI